MPQKKNLDLAELLRSKIHVVMGNYLQTISMVSNLPSGYNRDFQDTTKPLIESFLLTKQCLQMTQLLITQLTPCQEKIAQQMTPNLFATHHAYQQLAAGTPFRDAYLEAAEALKAGKVEIPKNYLKLSQHLGGTGNLQLVALMKSITNAQKSQQIKQKTLEQCLTKLVKGIIPASV
jgi:argininosuccinate lyase